MKLDEAIEKAKSMPDEGSYDERVAHGEWRNEAVSGAFVRGTGNERFAIIWYASCSECGMYASSAKNWPPCRVYLYCPYCGAKNRSELTQEDAEEETSGLQRRRNNDAID